MRSPSSKIGKVAVVLATPIAVVLAGALIWQASNAAFTSTTRNSGSNWETGSVAITDDDAGAARFQVSNMVPGQTETKCIKVTATTSVPGTIVGYLINPVTSPQGLENYIKVTVSSGQGGSFGSCTGFVADAAALPPTPLSTLFNLNSYEIALAAPGASPWTVTGGVAGGEHKTYQITWTFDVTGLTQSQQDGLQNAHTGVDVQWELRNS